ncbi:MAG TPA: sigma-54-dependent transcriptional regulator [Candidatus Brocadiia bacterium]|nr:response regulator [Planctomycetota bacterium]MDO8092977.1 response regulator [Candidatus Brocadiales bacterium]
MTKKVKRVYQPSILIVDDERELRNLFKKTLTEEGYNVLVAENGKEAIDVVKKDAPDLVLLDIIMPVMGGIDALRRLKAIRHGLPVVILTGYGTIESARTAMMLDADDYITKPFHLDYLKKVIKDALKSAVQKMETKTNLKKTTEIPLYPPLLKGELGGLKKKHCHGTAPCMWEVALRAFGFGDEDCALGWMEDPKVPAQDKTALVQLSHALASRVKRVDNGLYVR